MNKQFIDAYKILEINDLSNLTNKQIKNNYLKLIKQYHPDTLNSNDEDYDSKLENYTRLIQLINDAYELVKSVELRSKYAIEYDKAQYSDRLNNITSEYVNLKNHVNIGLTSPTAYHTHCVNILDMYQDKYQKNIKLTLKDGFESIFKIKLFKQLIAKPILKKFIYKTLIDNKEVIKQQGFIIDIGIENYDDENVSVMYDNNTCDVHLVLKNNPSLFTNQNDVRLKNLYRLIEKYLNLDEFTICNKESNLIELLNNRLKTVNLGKFGLVKEGINSFKEGNLYIQLDENIEIDNEQINLKLLNYNDENSLNLNNDNLNSNNEFTKDYTVNSMSVIVLFILSAYIIEHFIFK